MNIKVKGGQVLSGEITPSGNKNSALYVVPTSILFNGKTVLENIPDITDISRMSEALTLMGSKINFNKEKDVMEIDNSVISLKDISPENISKMRATTLLWGPLLARFGKIDFSGLPGGCTLGFRTLSAHLNAFRDLGVRIKESDR